MLELLDPHPTADVLEAEYRRLLGYPKDHVPGPRPRELAAWARQRFREIGRPWVYVREASLEMGADSLRIDGEVFRSPRLHQHLQDAKAERVLLMAVSAGAACEQEARRLWEDAKPDEYFFLEIFGSAVVEHLVAATNGRVCGLAEREGFITTPHYSPGYTGWDVADQPRLFSLIERGLSAPLPESLEVLSSGMLRPKKSLIAVIGLAPRPVNGSRPEVLAPCETCAFSPCQYRRRPYRFAPLQVDGVPTPPPRAEGEGGAPRLTRNARYSTNVRALEKWARERVRLEVREDGSVGAQFRFDGTTCSNQGRPLAFEYRVELSGPDDDYTIVAEECRPAPGDTGHTFMCAYLSDADGLMRAIAEDKPLLGRPIDDVLSWTRSPAPSGCYCAAVGRTHKWGLALEAIHYALVHSELAPDHGATSPLLTTRT